MKILIASDHAGFELKKKIRDFFNKNKIIYEDLGTFGEDKEDDYPDYAFKVAERVAKEKNSRGVLICGSGTGMVIAANKVVGIRAALAYDSYSAKMAAQDNNVNVLCLRGRFFAPENAKKIISTWIKTSFSSKLRHKRRIKKISDYEDNKNGN